MSALVKLISSLLIGISVIVIVIIYTVYNSKSGSFSVTPGKIQIKMSEVEQAFEFK